MRQQRKRQCRRNVSAASSAGFRWTSIVPLTCKSPKIADRKPVFVSGEVRDSLDRIVRYFGGRGMSASGMVENLVRLHLETYRDDIEQWRKL